MAFKLCFFLFFGFLAQAQSYDSLAAKATESIFPNVSVLSCWCSMEASFPGGHKALESYVNLSFEPRSESPKIVNKRIYVSFVVTVEGLIEQVKIERGIDPIVDEEIVRVLRQMPTWIPYQNGCDYIETRIMLPINICLL